MANCSLCGKEDLCFTCPYCKGVFCSEHRLPESHGCPGLQQAKEDARRKIAESFTGQYEPEEEKQGFFARRGSSEGRKSRQKRFSKQEKRDLIIASILVLLVGVSSFGFLGGIWQAIVIIISYTYMGLGPFILLSPVIFLISFMVHEMAHKFTAQHYGMWSEFRMTTAGYYMSAIAIVFSIPVFGTGVVLSSGASSIDEDAKVNLAGPFSNLILGLTMCFAALGIPFLGMSLSLLSLILFVFQQSIILNGMLGLFNMIPIQPFDGGTVFHWKKGIWAVVTLGLISLLIIGYSGIIFG
jgi:Zn-dependent protease